MTDSSQRDVHRIPPDTLEEALERARSHAFGSAAEALRCAGSLMDVLAFTLTEEPAHSHTALGGLAQSLEHVASRLEGEGGQLWPPLVTSMLDALDGEIRRWEERSRNDADARTVLRAFLSLREVLWEFGVRPRGDADETAAAPAEVDEHELATPIDLNEGRLRHRRGP